MHVRYLPMQLKSIPTDRYHRGTERDVLPSDIEAYT